MAVTPCAEDFFLLFSSWLRHGTQSQHCTKQWNCTDINVKQLCHMQQCCDLELDPWPCDFNVRQPMWNFTSIPKTKLQVEAFGRCQITWCQLHNRTCVLPRFTEVACILAHCFDAWKWPRIFWRCTSTSTPKNIVARLDYKSEKHKIALKDHGQRPSQQLSITSNDVSKGKVINSASYAKCKIHCW